MDEGEAEETKCEKRVFVRKWTAISVWGWDVENDQCPVCHNLLAVPCISCEADPNLAHECVPATGECSHSFHHHCISRWLRTRSTCPLDDSEFVFVGA